ncbi:MAG: hypothetical protein AVDCRST_MAG64-762, partial [uncultured Phycisphaerae bacterium]
APPGPFPPPRRRRPAAGRPVPRAGRGVEQQGAHAVRPPRGEPADRRPEHPAGHEGVAARRPRRSADGYGRREAVVPDRAGRPDRPGDRPAAVLGRHAGHDGDGRRRVQKGRCVGRPRAAAALRRHRVLRARRGQAGVRPRFVSQAKGHRLPGRPEGRPLAAGRDAAVPGPRVPPEAGGGDPGRAAGRRGRQVPAGRARPQVGRVPGPLRGGQHPAAPRDDRLSERRLLRRQAAGPEGSPGNGVPDGRRRPRRLRRPAGGVLAAVRAGAGRREGPGGDGRPVPGDARGGADRVRRAAVDRHRGHGRGQAGGDTGEAGGTGWGVRHPRVLSVQGELPGRGDDRDADEGPAHGLGREADRAVVARGLDRGASV